MRQLPAQGLVALDGPGNQDIAHVTVPAGSWGFNKSVFYRFAWAFSLGIGPMPPGYSVIEKVTTTQSAITTLLGPALMTGGIANSSNIEEFRIVRVGAGLYACNIGDNMTRSYINDANGQQFIFQLPPSGPPYDFTQPIQIDHVVTMSGTWPTARIDILWIEAFLEQGTNLGTLA